VSVDKMFLSGRRRRLFLPWRACSERGPFRDTRAEQERVTAENWSSWETAESSRQHIYQTGDKWARKETIWARENIVSGLKGVW